MSDVTKKVAVALSDEKLTLEQCRELLSELQPHHVELKARHTQIGRGDRPHQQIGGERTRVLQSGDVEALAMLNAETEAVEAELQILWHQRDVLTKRCAELLEQESVDGMPALYKSLEGALRAASAKRAAYVQALTDVQDALQALEDAHTAAGRAGLRGLPDGGTKLYELVAKVAPPEPPQRLFGRHASDLLERALGARQERAA